VSSPPPTRPAPTAAHVPSGWELIRVRPGDTLAGIARCRAATVDELVRANAIYDRNHLEVGWSLRVPRGDFCTAAAEVAGSAPQAPLPATPPKLDSRRSPSQAAQQLIDTARVRYDAGDFEGSLRSTERATRALARQRTPTGLRLRARAHLLAGMAAAGLGDTRRAIAKFRSARGLDPGVALTEADASPRLVELFRAAGGPEGPRAAVGDL
jgi:murein DD-endopeptidase MepM/ murein hydrolase activator NlpD